MICSSASRRARLHCHQRRVVEQRFVLNFLAVAQAVRAQPDQVEKIAREEIARAGGIGDGKTGPLPGAIKERDGAMIENVEERGQSVILGPDPLQDQLAVGVRERTGRAGEAHEVHHHLRRCILGKIKALDLTGGKAKPGDSRGNGRPLPPDGRTHLPVAGRR